MSDPNAPNGWEESARLVLSELKRLSAEQAATHEKVTEVRLAQARMEPFLEMLPTIEARVLELEKEQVKLKVKTGFIATVFAVGITVLMKVLGVPSVGSH